MYSQRLEKASFGTSPGQLAFHFRDYLCSVYSKCSKSTGFTLSITQVVPPAPAPFVPGSRRRTPGLSTRRTVLACGPLSPISSMKFTPTPDFIRSKSLVQHTVAMEINLPPLRGDQEPKAHFPVNPVHHRDSNLLGMGFHIPALLAGNFLQLAAGCIERIPYHRVSGSWSVPCRPRDGL